MYRNTNDGQTSIYDFILPFGGHLKEDNRWVQLRKHINWDIVDEEYQRNFKNKVTGQEAYPSSVAFGSLYIQRRLNLTDRELVEQIAENPYMQYFIGYKEYRSERPFDPSLLVTFRKRLPEEVMSRIIERSFIESAKKDNEDESDDDDDRSSPGSGGGTATGSKEPENKGTLIIDATCAPADIAFPTDLELCDKARRWTETILDRYWILFGSLNERNEKPRTYRETARRRFLKLNKPKAPTEFGAKISVSVVGGYTFIDRLSFDAYNEGEASEFERVVEMYRSRFGHYPERILADKIYRSKSNRAFCKSHGIRLSGPKLGRPGKNQAEEIRQELLELGERNAVEGKFGNGKRKLGLSLIMAKLQITTGSMIGMDIFILNMEKKMRWSSSLICAFLDILMSRRYPCKKGLQQL